MSHAIEAEGLVKRFGDTVALDGVDLTVPTGKVLGVLGPNGAGKTTAVRILATLLRADAGRASVKGYDVNTQPVAVRGLIGLTGQYASVDEDLNGTENLVLIGRLLNLSRADAKARAAELLERFELSDAAGRAIKTYSGGMRRRLDLAASLVGRPEVLFLDEPTTGLDPHARNEVWDIVRNLVADGATVLLTTQYLDEADQLADLITVIDHGRVIANGRPDELKRRTGGQTLQVRPTLAGDLDRVAAILHELTGAAPVRDSDSGLLTVPVANPVLLSTVVRRLDSAGIVADELALRLPSLDEVFLALTGNKSDETRELEGSRA
jgi:oleandomycin transport system ATP-binding protein